MPCDMMNGVDWGSVAHSELQTVKKALSQTQAMLCSIMRGLESAGILHAIMAQHDEKASGVTRAQMEAWFASHKAEDERRGHR